MITMDFTYEDLDGVSKNVSAQFHLSKTEMMANMTMKDKFEKLQNAIQAAPNDEMTSENQEMMVGLVQQLTRLAYGVRVGDRFQKSPERWEEFVETGKYDAFFFSLFEDTDRANYFMTGLMPADLRADAEKAAVTSPAAEQTVSGEAVETKKPSEMSREELLEAYRAKNGE